MNVNSLANKVSFINNFIMSENLSLLGICETWLIGEVESSYVTVDGFEFFRKDVVGSVRKHGVGMYVSNDIRAVQVEVDVPNTLVLFCSQWNLFLITIYRPPSYLEAENVKLGEFLAEFCLSRSTLVLGDFNLPSLRWSSATGVLSHYVSPKDRYFYDVFSSAGLVQLVVEPTYVPSGNILDLVLVSDSELVGEVIVLGPLPGCHHCPVVLDVLLPGTPVKEDEPEMKLWQKGNYSVISDRLSVINWDGLFEDQSVENCFAVLCIVVWQLCDEFIPARKFNSIPRWKSRPPRSLLHQRSQAWINFKNLRSLLGRRHDRVLRAWEEYSSANFSYRRFSSIKQCEYESYLASHLGDSPKLFHAYVRRLKKGRVPVGPLRHQGRLVTDPQEMCEILADVFCSHFRGGRPMQASPHQLCSSLMPPVQFSYTAVLKVL